MLAGSRGGAGQGDKVANYDARKRTAPRRSMRATRLPWLSCTPLPVMRWAAQADLKDDFAKSCGGRSGKRFADYAHRSQR
jgi:hypothetical protein